MCLRHWRMVPTSIKEAVLHHYRPGQCDDKKPSRAWHRAASAAIGFVARREKKPVTVAETFALLEFDYWPSDLKGLASLVAGQLRRSSKCIPPMSGCGLLAEDVRVAAAVLDRLAKEL